MAGMTSVFHRGLKPAIVVGEIRPNLNTVHLMKFVVSSSH